MLQLPNINETKDPILKKVILAVQELADQVGTRDTVIFHDINEQIKGLRADVKEGFSKQNQKIEGEFSKQNQILTDMATTLTTIAKNTEK